MHCNLIIVSLFPEAINSFISISCLPVAILLYHYCCSFKMQSSIFFFIADSGDGSSLLFPNRIRTSASNLIGKLVRDSSICRDDFVTV